jgi:hypothetical protein
MPISVAKLLVEIGANTQGLDKGLKESTGSVDTFTNRVNNLLRGVGIGLGLGSAGALIQKTFEFGKAGAQLDYAREKFDRLSDSMNATGDLMLGKLRDATSGMISDAQLVESAGSIMALGLTKTQDQTVRLARAVGALNMDMNQLVLTLANQTTMRFDQLGVSVDGFQERLNKLKASGMSVNDAFTEAFLQQAETQVEKVGDAANSTVAPYQRLETAVSNLGDAFKIRLTPGITSAATAAYDLMMMGDRLNAVVQQHGQEVAVSSANYQEYRKEIERAANVSGLLVKEVNGQILVYENAATGARLVKDQVKILTEAEWEEYRAAQAAAELRASFTDDDRLSAWAQRSAQGMDELTNKGDDNLRMWLNNRHALSDWQEAAGTNMMSTFRGLIDEQNELTRSMQQWTSGAASQAMQSLGGMNVKGERYLNGLKTIDEVMGTQYYSQQLLTNGLNDLGAKYQQTGDMEAYKQGLEKMKEEGLKPFQESLEESTKKAQALYEKLLALPQDIKIKVGFEVGDFPEYNKLPKNVTVNNLGVTSYDYHAQAAGGDWLVTKPTLFLAGEAGPERATFAPLKGGQPANDTPPVVVYATVDSQIDVYRMAETIADEIRRRRL